MKSELKFGILTYLHIGTHAWVTEVYIQHFGLICGTDSEFIFSYLFNFIKCVESRVIIINLHWFTISYQDTQFSNLDGSLVVAEV
jgi:hypothetical protein